MKPRTTLVLAVIFGVLCFGYYGITLLEKRGEKRALEQDRLFTFRAEDFSRISIQQEQGAPVVASRNSEGLWQIESPYALDAYQELWNRVAEQLAGLSTQRVLEEKPSDLAQYELDVPRLTVIGETKSGEKIKTTFGMAGPTRKNRYAQVNDKAVILVNEDAFFELNRGLDLLRDFRLLSAGDARVRRVEFARYWQGTESHVSEAGIEKGRESVVVAAEYSPEGGWRLVAPVEAVADQQAVERLVQRLKTEVCRDFVDEPRALEDYGLAPPRARISVFFEGESEPRTVLFGTTAREGKDPRIFAKRADRPAVFTVSKELERLFPASPTAFRQRLLLSRKPSDIVSIRFASGNDSFVLKNDDQKGWLVAEPQSQDTNQASVSVFIAHLADIEAVSFPEKTVEDVGLNNPLATFEIQYKDSETPGVIRIGEAVAETGLRYATQDTGTVVTISNEIGENLAKITVFTFVSKYLLQFKPEEAQKVTLRFEGTDYEFAKATTVWRVVKPEGKIWAAQSAMSALLNALSSVRAEGIEHSEKPQDLAPYGLDAPILTVRVAIDPIGAGVGQDLPQVAVGSLADGGASSRERYATAEHRSEIFLVKQDLVDDVREALKSIRDKAGQ